MLDHVHSWLSQISWEKIAAGIFVLSFIALLRFLEGLGPALRQTSKAEFRRTIQAVKERFNRSSPQGSAAPPAVSKEGARDSMNRKQLVVSLIAAAWISGVALTEPAVYWQDRIAGVVLKSIPAVIFGLILYLWFRRGDSKHQ
jgi:hypothetical protein